MRLEEWSGSFLGERADIFEIWMADLFYKRNNLKIIWADFDQISMLKLNRNYRFLWVIGPIGLVDLKL